MGGEDHIRMIGGDGGIQQIAEQTAELGNQIGKAVLPIGLFIQPAEHGGDPLGHKPVTVADRLVQKPVDGFQRVHSDHVEAGVVANILFHSGGRPHVPTAGGGS